MLSRLLGEISKQRPHLLNGHVIVVFYLRITPAFKMRTASHAVVYTSANAAYSALLMMPST